MTPADLVPRPALAARLAGALDDGAVELVAPAGYGKTVALQQALERRGGDAAWVRCTPADRDPGRLLVHLLDVLRGAVPGLGAVLGDRLAAAERVDVAAATRALGGELRRLLVDPLTLAVDDAEQLEGTPAESQVIAGLLDAGPLRVAVATRRPLASLPAGITRLGPADLAFSAGECAELLRRRARREPAAEEVEALWSRTEGWPLGVALAASPWLAPAAAPTGADGLACTLLDPLDAELRAGLVDSSVAPALEPAFLAALGLPERFPDELRDLGIPLTGTAHHPLVRELLLARFEAERPPKRQAAVHAAVAGVLEEAGGGAEAVEHWLAAGRADRAAAAVAAHGPALAATAPATVAGWLEQLPAAARGNPDLRLLEGRLRTGNGRLQEALGPLREAVAGFAARGDEEGTWIARSALADAYVIQEDFEPAIALADGFEATGARAAAFVAMAAAAALAGAGRFRDAEALLARAAALPGAAPLGPIFAGFRGFWVDLPCGRLDAAVAGTREAIALLERADPAGRLPYVIGFLAVIQDQRGEDGAALRTLAKAEHVAEESGAGGYLSEVARRFRAGTHARAGRLAEAERELAGLGTLPYGWFPGDSQLTRATVAARRGEHAAAVEAAGAAIEAGALGTWRSRWRTTAELVPVLVEAGRPAWARELIEEALSRRPPLASCARLLALRGWVRSLEGDDAGALEDVALAWDEAGGGPEHLVRRERPRLERLLWIAAEHDVLAPEALVAALEAAEPGGGALLPFVRHPVARVRRAAIAAAGVSGHPDAPGRVAELERDPDPAVASAARAARERLVRTPRPLAFTLLGGFSLRRGAYVVDDASWGRRRRAVQRLVRFLLVHRDVVTEEQLFAAFWPDMPADAARRSLQVTLSSARAVLDPVGVDRSALVAVDRTYRLGPVEVDADRFEAAAVAALAARGEDRAALLEAAAALWGGEPLPEDRDEDWAAPWRARLLELRVRVLAALADVRAAAGDPLGAADAARRLVELDPLDEGAHRRLMTAYARAGRRGHALRQYLACRRALVDGLGVEPAEETAALQRQILAGRLV